MEKERTLIYSADISHIKYHHYWGCKLKLYHDENAWLIELTDIYARDSYNDDEMERFVTLPKEFPDISPQSLKTIIENIDCSGPYQWGEKPYREVKYQEVEAILEAAKKVLYQV